MALLEGKKIIIIGDRDGIPAQAVEACLVNMNIEVLYASTECFV